MKPCACLYALLAMSILLSCSQNGAEDRPYEVYTAVDDCLYRVCCNGETYNFWLYVPENHTGADVDYPLLVFLHGWQAPFRGNPDAEHLSGGPLSPFCADDLTLNPDGVSGLNQNVRESIVVCPCVPYYNPNMNLGDYRASLIDAIIDYVELNYPVDEDRLYVTGLSWGAYGTYLYASERSDRLAAVMGVCGGPEFSDLKPFRDVPMSVFVSFDDGDPLASGGRIDYPFESLTDTDDFAESYPYQDGNRSMPAIADCSNHWDPDTAWSGWRLDDNRARGFYSCVVYRSGGHNAWDRAYGEDENMEWLYSKTRE